VKSRMVELPLGRKTRIIREYQLPSSDAQAFMWDLKLAEYFERIAKRSTNPKTVANWVINNLRAKLSEEHTNYLDWIADPRRLVESDAPVRKLIGLENLRFGDDAFLEHINLVETKTISHSAAQQVFAEMFDTGKSPALIVQEKGLVQVSDTDAIEKFCDEVIAANPKSAADYKAGKVAALNSLKGQVMKLSKGKANPALVGETLERRLKN